MTHRFTSSLSSDFDHAAFGEGLRLIGYYNEISFRDLVKASGIHPNTVSRALHSPKSDTCGLETYEKLVTAAGCKDMNQFWQFREYIVRHALVYHQDFGKILTHWRITHDCMADPLAQQMWPDRSIHAADTQRRNLERGSITTPQTAAHGLKHLGLEAVYDLIKLAGVEERYPLPSPPVFRPEGFPKRTPIALLQPGAVFPERKRFPHANEGPITVGYRRWKKDAPDRIR